MSGKAIETTKANLKKDLKLLDSVTYLYVRNKENRRLIIDVAEIPFMGGIKMTLTDAYKLYFDVDGILQKDVIVPATMLNYYVEKFLKSESDNDCYCINLLARHQFMEGDNIQFPPDKAGRVKIGVISGDFKQYTAIHYRVLKKDGTLGKIEYVLYGGVDYKLLNRDFIDYGKI